MLGLEAESRLLGLRPVDVRDVRRLLLPRPGDRRRRRRRQRRRGGHVPHQVRLEGHPDPPSRRAAGVEDHAGAGVQQPEDRVPVEHRRRRPRRRRRSSRAPSSATCRPARSRRCPSPACSSPSGTAQHRPVQGRARHGRQRLPRHPARLDVHQRRRRLRLRRRAGPHLPPGDHRGRLGLHGRHRLRALAGGQSTDTLANGRAARHARARECMSRRRR